MAILAGDDATGTTWQGLPFAPSAAPTSPGASASTRTRNRDRSLLLDHSPTATRSPSFWKKPACPIASSPSASARGEQFAPEFLKISPTTAFRPRRPGPADGGSRQRLRIRRHPLLSCGKDRPFPPRRPAGPQRNPAVAVLADGRPRPHGRPEPPFRPLRPGTDPLRHRALRPGDHPPLRRSRPPPRRPGMRRRRLFHRRHGDLPWIVPWQRQGSNSTTSPPRPLVRRPRRPPRRTAGYARAEAINPKPKPYDDEAKRVLFGIK